MKKNRTEELLKEKLREKGLKVTNQRILILSVLEQNKGRHLTAEDIYELVTQEHRTCNCVPYDPAFMGYAAHRQD